MNDAAALETALRAALPPEHALLAPELARALADAIAYGVVGDPPQQRLESAELARALTTLRGHTLTTAGATIVFAGPPTAGGDVGTLQQITISGGAVGGPIIGSIQVVLPSAAPSPKLVGWQIVHPYPMPPNFTGRETERAACAKWLDHDPDTRLLAVRALGGFGKSALAWQWLTHDVDEQRWPRVLWWNFEEAGADFGVFLREAVAALGGDPHGRGSRQLADDLLRELRRPGTLLILDGFERQLRAFAGLAAAYQGDLPRDDDRACADANAEHMLRGVCALPGIAGKLLLITRLRPRALEVGTTLLAGCRELELTALTSGDAVRLLRAEGVRGADADLARTCARSGHHPLSLRLLAGLVMGDLQRPGDIRIAEGLSASSDPGAILSQAYAQLSEPRRALLSRIACFRSPVGYETLRAIAERPETLDSDLRDLIDRGLLSHDQAAGRFDLHQIVRHYAYDQLGVTRGSVHAQLRDYFAAVPQPAAVERVDDLLPTVELYHHTLHVGLPDEAWQIYNSRLHAALYYRLGAYPLLLQLLDALPRDREGRPTLALPHAQIWTLFYSAMCCERLGALDRAREHATQARALSERYGSPRNAAQAQILFAMPACDAGLLAQAEQAMRAAVAWFDNEEDANWCGIATRSLGRVLLLCGRYEEAQAALDRAHAIYGGDPGYVHGRAVTYENEALLSRLQGQPEAALRAASSALQLADSGELSRERGVAHWHIAAALLTRAERGAQVDGAEVEGHLTAALESCRRWGLIEFEPGVLLSLAQLRWSAGQPDLARAPLAEALELAERCGYRLWAADAQLLAARLALEAGDTAHARVVAQQAHRLARCEGPPDHTYRATYEAAGQLLAHLAEP